MGKFDSFIEKLIEISKTKDIVIFKFSEIESILHKKLAKSARMYDVYWKPSGRIGGLPVRIVETGFKVIIPNLENETVKLLKR